MSGTSKRKNRNKKKGTTIGAPPARMVEDAPAPAPAPAATQASVQQPRTEERPAARRKGKEDEAEPLVIDDAIVVETFKSGLSLQRMHKVFTTEWNDYIENDADAPALTASQAFHAIAQHCVQRGFNARMRSIGVRIAADDYFFDDFIAGYIVSGETAKYDMDVLTFSRIAKTFMSICPEDVLRRICSDSSAYDKRTTRTVQIGDAVYKPCLFLEYASGEILTKEPFPSLLAIAYYANKDHDKAVKRLGKESSFEAKFTSQLSNKAGDVLDLFRKACKAIEDADKVTTSS